MKLVISVPSKPARIARSAASACWLMQSRISSLVITLGGRKCGRVWGTSEGGVQDLLDRHRSVFPDIGGDAFELGQEIVVENRHLAGIGLALAQRVGIGPLVGDDATAGAGDDAHA